MAQNQPNSSGTTNWRDLRRQEREEWRAQRRGWRGNNSWVIGAVFILLGFLLIAQNLGALALHNWWALFILIPAAGSFAAAWRTFSNSGGLPSALFWGPFFGGLVLTLITVAFLFDLSWGLLGPLALILLGVGALLGALTRRT